MTFLVRLSASLIQAAVITAMWAALDWAFKSGTPWHYSEAFYALFTGAMVAGPWTKRQAMDSAQRTLSAAQGTK